jgi:protocatechuate 4,5-dioxygenase alpha chain
MTGMTQEEYAKMMLEGGRSPEGNRYVGETAGEKKDKKNG